jgi:hypothetical protein
LASGDSDGGTGSVDSVRARVPLSEMARGAGRGGDSRGDGRGTAGGAGRTVSPGSGAAEGGGGTVSSASCGSGSEIGSPVISGPW